MSTSENKPARSSRRRYVLLLSAIVLVVAGWSAAWLYGRSLVSDQLALHRADLASMGLEISCTDLGIAGYPFRFEVSCRDMRSLDSAGTAGSLKSLRAVALIYNPWHVIFEAEAPAAAVIPAGRQSGQATWETARASVKFSRQSLEAFDAVIEKPEAVFENAISTGTIAAEKSEIHLRKVPDRTDVLDGYISVDGLALQSIPELQETVSLRGHVQIPGGAGMLAGADIHTLIQAAEGQLPMKLVLFEATVGDSSVGADGDLVINGDGTLSGKLDLTLANAAELLRMLRPVLSLEDNTRTLVESVVNGLEPAGEDGNGAPTVKLPVVIDHGAMRIGFLPFGQIPPLFSGGT